jgi:hypothetical protein
VGLRLSGSHSELAGAVEPELRVAAEAIGVALWDQLVRLAPGLTRAPEAVGGVVEATLVDLDLDHEGAPDGVSLVACVAAHRAYVAARKQPDGASAGALALARLLVWGQRAAMLGPAPRIAWLGPAPRAPRPEAGQVTLAARCALSVGGSTRRAEAVAVIARPDEASPSAG